MKTENKILLDKIIKNPVCFMLLTKEAAGGNLLEKVQEQIGLAFHVGF